MSSYEIDFVVWTERQSELLRRRAAGEIVDGLDLPNLAEEIASLGLRDRRELRRRMERLLRRLLKWHFQPEHRSRGRLVKILTRRRDIEALLEDSPSLRHTLADVVAAAYPEARQHVEDETGLLHLPGASPFTADQALSAELLI
jgi:hypothetical protein